MRRLVPFALLLCAGLVLPAAADRFTVSFAAGLSSPRQAEVRDLYGTFRPLAFEARLRLWGGLGVLGGLQSSSREGEAVRLSGSEGAYPLLFTLDSFPVGLFYRVAAPRFAVLVAAGPAYFRYEESWETAGIMDAGRLWGWFGQLAVEVAVFKPVALFAAVRYQDLPCDRGSLLADEVNLGGLSVLGGLTLSLF